ncbi:MAG: hypothetical protein HVN35_08785 [Methanobacteriaceae archaeon]|nr:hypothetical protein [Methanobacteriaceae archaeon]
MKQRSISKIFFKLPYELNETERKTQALLLIPFGLISCFIVSYLFVGILMGFNFIPFFAAMCLIVPGVIMVLYCWDKFDKKYGMRPVRSPFQLSYQGYVIVLLCSSPAFFFGMLTLGLMSGNLFFGLGAAVAVVYPIVGMFLRIKTFSDESIPRGGGFGFMPISYWIMAEALGIYTIGKGFSGISSYLINGTPSLEFIIASIAIGLLIQTVYLFPDKLNKIVPIELRTKNGFLFMFVMAFVLFGVSQFLIGIVRALTS